MLVFRRYAHVCQKKLAWPGARLAISYPEEFGQLLDYARSLEFNDTPDYDAWRSNFRALFERSGFGPLSEKTSLQPISAPEKITETPTATLQLVPTEECIVQPGQLVYVHILPRHTVEGYTGQANDESYWHDPTLSGDEWKTKLYPAAILSTSWDSDGYYRILAIPIGRGRASAQRKVNIVNDITFPTLGTDAVALPEWPLEDAYFYAFPCSQTFYSLPRVNKFAVPPVISRILTQSSKSTPVLPVSWKLSGDDVKKLIVKFSAPAPSSTYSEADLKARAILQDRQSFQYKVYAGFVPMTLETLNAQHTAEPDTWLAEWESERCWFDELVKINKRRTADAGWGWTADACQYLDELSQSDENTYWENSCGDWDRQLERDTCMTLDPAKLTSMDVLTNVKVVRTEREPVALMEE
ncbi:hypothetical protein H0H81_001007 [Sphagnurus paluster]|uniref:Uncharacterized protein n=1 Tax=Sphagnurus paluster TaxID=117069 RepID=A0A9P7GHD0_9AGAR|nr:hypothetical protein H0H81_001007 [Sphagnurus paluster]